MAAIAERAGVPKANMHYYFPTKQTLYRAVIERVLTAWLAAAVSFDTSDDPREALTAYIGAKMDLAREMPLASRIWSAEIMRGAPIIQDFLDTTLSQWVASRERAVQRWIAAGKLRPIEPKVPLLHDLGDDPAIRQRLPRDGDLERRPPPRRRRVRAGEGPGDRDDSGRGDGLGAALPGGARHCDDPEREPRGRGNPAVARRATFPGPLPLAGCEASTGVASARGRRWN